MIYAPIVLFVYNRLDHTQKTIDALKNNVLASESELFVFSDAAKNFIDNPEKTGLIQSQVSDVRKYIHTIKGFRKVTVIEQPENKGLANSIIDGVTSIVNRFGKIIVLEDDLVTSPYFLQFMNDALNFYENEDQVISIHGYTYPMEQPLPETYFVKGADCWGWATWKRGWALFENDGEKLLRELQKRKLTKEFDFNNAYSYTQMLKDQIAGKNNSWAIRWYASAFLHNKLTLYPGQSLVRNIGNDGSGVHSGENKYFEVTLNPNPVSIDSHLSIEETIEIRKKTQAYFRQWNKPLSLFNRIIFLLNVCIKKMLCFIKIKQDKN